MGVNGGPRRGSVPLTGVVDAVVDDEERCEARSGRGEDRSRRSAAKQANLSKWDRDFMLRP